MELGIIGWIFIISSIAYIPFILIMCAIAKITGRKFGEKMANFIMIWGFIDVIFLFAVKTYVKFM